MRGLDLVKPFARFLPEVAPNDRKILFQEKLLWTLTAILIYLVCSQIPLFGIMISDKADPVYWLRAMMAGNRGTLMDLGLGPILMAGSVTQFLTFVDLIKVDENIKEDSILFSAFQKLLALLITFAHALIQVSTGFFGSPSHLGMSVCLLIVVQLMFSGVIIVLLDELLQKGYGLGSGVNLFIVANICESIVWKAFSPSVYSTGRGPEFEGSVLSFLQLLKIRRNKLEAIYEAFFRKNLPNLFCLASTATMFCLVIYLYNIRLELPLDSMQAKTPQMKWAIKLFYVSSTPIILQNQAITTFYRCSRFLSDRCPGRWYTRILGVWDIRESLAYEPVSGIAYYISPPSNVLAALKRPIHFLIYSVFMLGTSALLAYYWMEMNESSPTEVGKQLTRQKLVVKGHSVQGTQDMLNRYIPIAAVLSGIIIGGISIMSDLLDTIGSGQNIILAVSIIGQYFELFAKEQMKYHGTAMVR
ncbi:protein transport protein SEC61 subunit alpha [Nematocida homosporus]|uniref:protein transport protein SEC61 subunit alpha n=1 Tax=Nematocida homosporus TaxID=1912981 RepID=UPI00221FF0C1|nr:protein transport protein SEC61 subunit alpha [Nematocida homosporus]KAI5186851.1 protein transport protein SEC61 subunit alpha [Nematocida homosporus]